MLRPSTIRCCGLLAVLTLLSVSCADDSEYSPWPCSFAYDNGIHFDTVLGGAMDANSRGIFCTITETVQGGVRYLNFESSNGTTSQQRETAPEQKSNFVLGLNNGIIVGFQSLITTGYGAGFAAYDAQCPNCVKETGNTINPNYRIKVSTAGIGTCQKCGNRYDLNYGGVILTGSDGQRGLQKYRHATTSGPFGLISVFR